MFLGRKRKLEVDLGELGDKKEALSSFLHSKLKVDATPKGNKVLIDSESLSPEDLKRMVNKFVYHQNLMNKYWVALEGSVIRIYKFKHSEEHKKSKKGTPPSTIRHGW